MKKLPAMAARALFCLAFAVLFAGCQVQANGQMDVGMGVYRLQQL